MPLFSHILTIGDSMTEGCFNTEDDYYVKEEYSWPSYLRKITGCDVKNWGKSGFSSKEWWNHYKDSIWFDYDCAIIQLGINDHFKKEAEETEIYIGKIIDKLHKENPGIKVFVSTIVPSKAYSGNGFDNISNHIRNLVKSRNDCYLVDLANYGHTNDSNVYNAGHLTALGYLCLAQDYARIINGIIHNNQKDFKFIHFTGTNNKPYIK